MPQHYLTRGDRAPVFELLDPLVGGLLHSAELLRSGSLLITFYRGAWCGCCQADLRDLKHAMPWLRTNNIIVLGVFHELNPEACVRIRNAYQLEFPLVDDPYGRAAKLFGIRRSFAEMAAIENEFGPDLLALKEGQPWILPMQARFMIGQDGIIMHSEVLADYNDRSSVECLLPSKAPFSSSEARCRHEPEATAADRREGRRSAAGLDRLIPPCCGRRRAIPD